MFTINKSYLIALIFICLSMTCPYAVQAESLTWQEAVKITEKNHPDLIAARYKISEAKADTMAAQSDFLPQVSADLSADRSKSSPTAQRVDSYSYGISARQLLFDGFKTVFEVQNAVRQIHAQQYEYDVVSSNLRYQLREAFIELIKSRQYLQLASQIAQRRKQSRDMIYLRYQAGREHRGSLLTSEANWAQAQYEIEEAKRQIILSERKLLTALGKSQLEPVDIEGDLNIVSEVSDKPNLEHLAEETPFLKQLIILKEAAKWQVRSSRSDFFPQVYLDASLGKSGASWPVSTRHWSMGATASVPLFEGGANIAALDKSQSVLKQVESQEKSGRLEVLITLENTWSQFRSAVENVAVEQKFLEAATERAFIAQSEYSAGLLGFNEWIIIEDNLVRAEKTLLDAKANALLAQARWMQAKGVTLDEK